jgi:hypothetical protein
MKGLMMDTPGSSLRTREQVEAIKVPNGTHTWFPNPYADVIGTLYDYLGRFGLKVREEKDGNGDGPSFGVGHDGAQLFGVVPVEGQDSLNGTVGLTFGFRSSYDRTLRTDFCYGHEVFVCSNMCFSGYTNEEKGITAGRVGHKQTRFGNKGFKDRLWESLSNFEAVRSQQDNFLRRLQGQRINDDAAFGTLVRACREGVLSSHQVINVANRWKVQETVPDMETPPPDWHAEFQARTPFTLLNCATEELKTRMQKCLTRASDTTMELTRFFQIEFN